MLYWDKKTFNFAVFVLIQTKDNPSLEGRESEQQAMWSAKNRKRQRRCLEQEIFDIPYQTEAEIPSLPQTVNR